jgi:hypothetical protein
MTDIQELNARIQRESAFVDLLDHGNGQSNCWTKIYG